MDDDSGTYDVRGLRHPRKEDRIVYVNGKTERTWFLTLVSSLIVLSIGAAWSANQRLAAVEAQLADVRAELAEVKRLIEPRYRGGGYDATPR